MHASNHYILPVPREALRSIDRTSSPTHVANLRNAIDLIVPINTPVLAAADGTVTFVRDNSDIGGPFPAYVGYTNFIVIKHAHDEYTRYDHLSHRSSKVSLGQQVCKGEQIANVGVTGYSFIPHLHFQVFVFTGTNIWTDFDTLEVEF